MKLAVSIAIVLLLSNVSACQQTGDAEAVTRRATKSPIQHFVALAFDRFPRSVVMRDFCDTDDANCFREVRSSGAVWAGDVNGDHIDELVLFPGSQWAGSAGRNYFLYQRQGGVWQLIVRGDETKGWLTDRPRFEILPISRNGYRDLRIDVIDCLKWSGGKYVPYDAADYAGLVPAWFDQSDPHQAEILWAIRHGKAEPSRLEPQWFPISSAFFYNPQQRSKINSKDPQLLVQEWHDDGALPRVVSAAVDDGEQNIRWVSLMRAGVWGIRGSRAFLLVPRMSYLGVCTLQIKGDWLIGYEDCEPRGELSEPDVRYNRRTRELQISSSEEMH